MELVTAIQLLCLAAAPLPRYGVGICRTVPTPGGQTPIRDTDCGVCHMAPVPGSQPLVPSRGLIRSTGKEVPGAPGTGGNVYSGGVDNCYMTFIPDSQLPIPSIGLGLGETIPLSSVVEFGHNHAAKLYGGLLLTQNVSVGVTQNMSVGVTHKAAMPGDQTHVPCVGISVCPSSPMPGNHLDLGVSVLGGPPLIKETFSEAGLPAPLPSGSGVGQGLSAPIPVGHPFSAGGTCEDDELEVPPNQEGVSLFLHLIGQVRAYLLLSPETPSSSQLTGVERAQLSFALPALTYSPTVTYGSCCP